MPTGSWQRRSLPGSVFTWVDLGPFPAFPDVLNAQYLELGCLLSSHHMGPRDMTSGTTSPWHQLGVLQGGEVF